MARMWLISLGLAVAVGATSPRPSRHNARRNHGPPAATRDVRGVVARRHARRTAAFASANAPRRRGNVPLWASSDPDQSGTVGKRARAISPYIDAYTERQLSNIFGSGDGSDGTRFVPLSLAGRWSERKISEGQEWDVEAMVLSSPDACVEIANAYEKYLRSQGDLVESDGELANALPIPISPSSSPGAMKLLTRAYSSTPLSKSVLLALNPLIVNRDGGLFDNLPWSTWSIDPELSERDAANNVVDGKYTMGKRVAYQRFMGKDWQGRSLSLGNMANRIRYMLEKSDEPGDVDKSSMNDEEAMVSLSQRLLELTVKEAQMEIAECEQRLAISRTKAAEDEDGDEAEARKQLEQARNRLQTAESSLEELASAMQSGSEDSTEISPSSFPWQKDEEKDGERSKTQTLLASILDRFTAQENPPPYRGAIGFPAKLDSKKEMLEDSVLPYSSPYELLLEIIDEQLNSEVMACVLEPTSLLEGNLVLGGALLLKRKGVEKSITLAGEVVSYTDDDDDLGNKGVLPRSMYVVECFSDEAVGVALASNIPIFVEEEICNKAGKVPLQLDRESAVAIKTESSGGDNSVEGMEILSFANRVPPVRPTGESSFSPQLEGETVVSENDSNRIRIPLTTNPELFGGPGQTPGSSSNSRSVFSTFNPVKDLDEYDGLSDDAKARLLLKLESFTDYFPRPRAVRMSAKASREGYEEGSPPSVLDDILLPLVDESVRRQYLIRDAERRQDFKEVERLRSEASPRQSALEGAQRARDEGFDAEAQRLEEEAELYKALRADVTQDEGAYNRYLDQDEWYARETQARVEREREKLKKKFGTLLDGIDLP